MTDPFGAAIKKAQGWVDTLKRGKKARYTAWHEAADNLAALREPSVGLAVALQKLFVEFQPEHIDAVSGTKVGTEARAALLEWAQRVQDGA